MILTTTDIRELQAEIVRLRDGLRDISNYGQTYGGQTCADIAYEMLTGEKPDVPKQDASK